MSRRTLLALVAMGIAVLVVANDFTAFTVALPSIEKSFHIDLATAQWVVNAYALVFGVVIVTGGRLADMFGRRRIFVVGTSIFAAFSLLAGLAPDAPFLILSRGLMGIGGALMWPSILGMTYDLLPEEKAGLAGGLIIGVAGFGNAVGPTIGGVLTDTVGWRWIFFLNLPIAALGIAATLALIPRDAPATGRQRLDYPGVTTLTAGLVALLLALDLSSTWGWSSPRVEVLVVATVVFLVVFAVIEWKAGSRALLPKALMRNRTFVAACASVLCMSAVFFAILLYVPQILIKSLGYSSLEAGLGLAPMMITFGVVSFVAGPLYARIGPRILVVGGAGVMTAGILYLSFLSGDSTYTYLVPGLVVVGIGVGSFYSSVTTAGVTALDASHLALAGGVLYMCQVAGGSVGLGINTAIVTASPTSVSQFVDGISNAFTFDAVLAFVATMIAAVFVGRRSEAVVPSGAT